MFDQDNPLGFLDIYQGKIPSCVCHDVNISDWESYDTKCDPSVFWNVDLEK